jgi:beta-glucosidase
MSNSPIGPQAAKHAPMFEVDGVVFRDLDHDGRIAPYEDWRLTAGERAEDLLGRLTLGEKAGLMMHGTAVALGGPLGAIGYGPGYDLDALDRLVNEVGVSTVISRLGMPARELAIQNNALQAVAARGRLGIPVAISTDPRHHFAAVTGASTAAGAFTQWPETLGLAATRDPELVRRFGDVVRQEYRAVGFHIALSPQADLATSPRWPRIEGTFGEDPQIVRALVGAYVEGVQGGTAGPGRADVAAVVKHWVGYGASRDGFDGHNYYGRFSAFPGERFQDHVDAFLDAFAARVAGVMPTYNILDGLVLDGVAVEAVGAGFERELLTGLLRGHHGFDGLVVSDWAITKDITEACRTGVPPQQPSEIAMPWGVEHLTRVEKFAKGVDAGLDQFGGENDPAPLLQAVRDGLVTEARLDESVRRVLVQKFELGLFDDPFVDPDAAVHIVGQEEFREDAAAAQRRGLVLVKGDRAAPPVRGGDRVYLHGIDRAAFDEAGLQVVEQLAEATVAVVRVSAPFEVLHPGHFFGSFQHEGSLEFPADHPDFVAVATACRAVPTVVIAHLDRPAVLTEISHQATVLIAEFGASAQALVDVLVGAASADGGLPFQLPRSMGAVLARRCDVACDDPDPLFPLFFRAPG